MNDETNVIVAYSRAQAIEDGVLVDVSEVAEEAGLRLPVALTQAVYGQYVKVPEGVTGQDEQGRLWDILHMLRCEVIRRKGEPEILFRLYVRNDNRKARLVTLKSVCGANDDGSPYVTIMMPEED